MVWPELLELADPGVRTAFREITGPTAPAEAAAPPGVSSEGIRATFQAFRTVQAAEAWRVHGAWIVSHPDALGPDVAARFAWAATVTAEQERDARAVLDRVRDQLDAALGDADILLLPATPTPAPLRTADAASLDAARTATISLTCLAAITGRPALSAPLLSVDGAPVGLSLLGPRGADLDLVARAAALAQRTSND